MLHSLYPIFRRKSLRHLISPSSSSLNLEEPKIPARRPRDRQYQWDGQPYFVMVYIPQGSHTDQMDRIAAQPERAADLVDSVIQGPAEPPNVNQWLVQTKRWPQQAWSNSLSNHNEGSPKGL